MRTDGFGLKGLNKGLTATLGRHGVFNMVYFSFYHNVKGMMPPIEVKNIKIFNMGIRPWAYLMMF